MSNQSNGQGYVTGSRREHELAEDGPGGPCLQDYLHRYIALDDSDLGSPTGTVVAISGGKRRFRLHDKSNHSLTGFQAVSAMTVPSPIRDNRFLDGGHSASRIGAYRVRDVHHAAAKGLHEVDWQLIAVAHDLGRLTKLKAGRIRSSRLRTLCEEHAR